MLNVEMLSTGDEVLHGQIVDTNAAWLADFFFHQGVPLSRRNTVGDNLDSLVAILRERSQHADVLIVNGGLGPTSDDLSALAAATAKGEGLVLHQAWLTEMERYFQQRGRVMAPSNRKQAELPASAEFINTAFPRRWWCATIKTERGILARNLPALCQRFRQPWWIPSARATAMLAACWQDWRQAGRSRMPYCWEMRWRAGWSGIAAATARPRARRYSSHTKTYRSLRQ